MADWMAGLKGVIMGVVAFVVVDELLAAFSIGGTDAPAGESLIATLVPIAIAVGVVLFAFNGMR